MEAVVAESSRPRAVQPYRELLLAEMAKLCAGSARAQAPGVREKLGEVFVRVLSAADRDVRRRFAEAQAEAAWTPPNLALALAGDEIEVAQPVITASPALDEPALLGLVAKGSPEHRAAVASREGLGPRLADAVLDTHEPLALAALAANGRADLSAPVLRRLVEESRTTVALRAPLVRRADLYGQLARRMAEWVGPELRAELARRFEIGEAPAQETPEAEQETEERLVQKLRTSGQLKPGFLVRTLREGKLSLFEVALAALGGFAPAEIARAAASQRPDLLALACASVGIDRSVFPTVLDLVRGLNGGRPGGGDPQALEAALNVSDRHAAAYAFRNGLAGMAVGAL